MRYYWFMEKNNTPANTTATYTITTVPNPMGGDYYVVTDEDGNETVHPGRAAAQWFADNKLAK